MYILRSCLITVCLCFSTNIGNRDKNPWIRNESLYSLRLELLRPAGDMFGLNCSADYISSTDFHVRCIYKAPQAPPSLQDEETLPRHHWHTGLAHTSHVLNRPSHACSLLFLCHYRNGVVRWI